jgi:pimeloyl-ACP methyl ester carboxylesterase
MKHIEHAIPSLHNQKKITYDLRYDENLRNQPLIIFLHGFKGFKDWGHFNMIADSFVEKGFAFLKMNFSHNGTSAEHLVDFVDLEAFGNNNFSIELDDIGTLLNHLETEKNECINYSKIHLLGHSKGGATAIIKSSEDNRITKGATLASVIMIKNRYANELENWKNKGVIYIPNSRTNQEMPLYYQLAEDVLANKGRFNIPEIIAKSSKELLLVHGAKDETVTIEELDLVKGLNPKVKTYVIPDTNHTFEGAHPWIEKQLHIYTQEAIETIAVFFQ